MSLQFGPCLAILLLLSVPLAKAQTGSSDSTQSSSSGSSQSGATDSSQSGTTESSPQDQSSYGPQQVFDHPQDNPRLGFLGEVTSNNYIKLGMGASLAYDTSAFAFSTPAYSQTQGVFSPSIQLTQTRPKVTWNVSAGGALITSNAPGYTTTSNPNLQGSLLYQISERWQLNVSDTYLYTLDPFQQYSVYSGSPTFNQPNPTVYAPLVTTESNSAFIDLTYQMSAHDSLTFTGTQNFTEYVNNYNLSSSLFSSLYNWYSWGGVAQYRHVFSPRFSAGGSYSYTAVDYGRGQSRSGIQTIQGFATYKINPRISLTGWVGPDYTATKNLVPIFCSPFGCYIEEFHNASWSNAFGGNFGWNGQRDSAVVGFSKAITNGGILYGIVQLYQVRASYIRQINPLWSVNLSGLFGNNNGASTRFHAQHLHSLTGYASLTRQLTPALSASVTYAYFNENQENLPGATAPKWIDNRFQFSLQYTWGHSLGR
jgi:hypothetical protein